MRDIFDCVRDPKNVNVAVHLSRLDAERHYMSVQGEQLAIEPIHVSLRADYAIRGLWLCRKEVIFIFF